MFLVVMEMHLMLLEVNARPSLFVLKSRCGSMAVKKKKQSESESKMSSQIHCPYNGGQLLMKQPLK